jgi:hypothetical protein
MVMCFTDLLIGTMESQRKIGCWRKHGTTKKEEQWRARAKLVVGESMTRQRKRNNGEREQN